MNTVRLTVAQATVRFLVQQHSERDGRPTVSSKGASGYSVTGTSPVWARRCWRPSSTLPVRCGTTRAATSRGWSLPPVASPGCATGCRLWPARRRSDRGRPNMVTGAALATVNRMPVLLLPGGRLRHADRRPVLQQLEQLGSRTFRSTTRSGRSRALRPGGCVPSNCPTRLMGAMRVLIDPAETGAVTHLLARGRANRGVRVAEALFAPRTWRSPGRPDPAALAQAERCIVAARRPLIVAGGGVIYSEATEALRSFVEATGIPVAETQAGKGSLPYDHPQAVGAIGVTGPPPPTPWRRPPSRPRCRHALDRFHDSLADGLRADGAGSSTATSPPSTPPSTPASLSSETPARPCRLRRPSEPAPSKRPTGTRHRPRPPLGRRRHTGVRGSAAAASTVGSDRGRGRRCGPHVTSSSAPQAPCPANCTSSGARGSEGLSRRVRLLLHGLRDRRRPRRENGRTGP